VALAGVAVAQVAQVDKAGRVAEAVVATTTNTHQALI
jgi:hypothetical protein